jgi:hypothetical protein
MSPATRHVKAVGDMAFTTLGKLQEIVRLAQLAIRFVDM